MEQALEQHPGCAIGGQTMNALADNPFAEASERVIDRLYQSYSTHPGQPRFFTTNNVGLAADAFRAVGGLDVTWSNCGGEERDLFARWQRAGYGMHFAAGMIVRHAHHLTWWGFAAQHFAYGRGAFLFHSRHASRHAMSAFTAPRRAPLAFYLGLPMAAFAAPAARHPIRVALLLVLSQLWNAAGFLAETVRATRAAWSLSLRRARGHATATVGPRVPYDS
jgi:hypothetical protein